MTALDKLKTWLGTYSGHDILSNFFVDYTDKVPSNGGVFPSGLVEVERSKDILGDVTVTNQYNFALYYVFEKSPGGDEAVTNADWIEDFQGWVQAQSILGSAPSFGDETNTEKITAQNGVMYDSNDEGTAMYMVQLAVQFKKIYLR